MLGNKLLILMVLVGTCVDGIDRHLGAKSKKGMHMSKKLPKLFRDFDASSLVGNYEASGDIVFIPPNETLNTEFYMKITGTDQPYFFYEAHCYRRKGSSPYPPDWATEDGALVAKYQDRDDLIWLGIAEKAYDEVRPDIATGTWDGIYDGDDSIHFVSLNPKVGLIVRLLLTRTDVELGDDGCPVPT